MLYANTEGDHREDSLDSNTVRCELSVSLAQQAEVVYADLEELSA